MKVAGRVLLVALVVSAAGFVPVSTVSAAPPLATSSCADHPLTGVPIDVELPSYQAINPVRLVDTRDGTGGLSQRVGQGCTLELDLTQAPIPSGAQAVGISLTAVSDTRGFFTVFPCASGRPETSNLNSRAGMATPNFVVALLDASRRVCVYSQRDADVVIDLSGWWSAGPDRFRSIDPVRAYDSRRELPIRLPAGAVQNVPIGGRFVPADATAAVINLTATESTQRGWLAVFPCGNAPPKSSNLNVLAGENRAVAAIVGLGRSGAAAGQLCVTSNIDTHFVIDLTGYYAPASPFGPASELRPQAGERLMDTRNGTGGWSTPFPGGVTRSIDPVATGAVADRATSVLVNVVATNGAGLGNVRVFACRADGSVPESSSVNFGAVLSATNLVSVDLDASRKICIYTSNQADIVVDLFAVMVAAQGSLVERLSFGTTVAYPRFEPAGADYALVCAAGTNRLTLDVVPLPFATVKVRGVPVRAGTVTLSATADDLIPVEVARGAVVAKYWFRCLPSNFPRLAIDRPGSPAPGWYLTTFGQGSNPEPGFFSVIFDQRGAPVWYKQSSEVLVNLQRRPDGTLLSSTQTLYFGTTSENLGHWVTNLDGTNEGVWRTDDATVHPVDHHDVVQLPDGGWAIVSYPFRDGVDTSDLPGGGFVDDAVVDGAIVEFDAAGNLGAWEWHTDDLAQNGRPHFGIGETTFVQRFGKYVPANGGEVDLVHMNSAQRLDDGDYIASARHLDAVFRIDRATKEVEWILGSLPSDPTDPGYIANSGGAPRLRILNDPWGGPRRQHDARLQGDLLIVHDNRTGMVGQSARVAIYQIDTTALTATLVREIRNPAGQQSGALGSARLGADGSVLVNWGGLQPMFQEFDASNQLMLSIARDPYGASYRIVKYPASDFDVNALRANAGGTIETPPPPLP